MVVVTHEMGFARHVSSHVIFLHQVKLKKKRHPDALFGAPKKPAPAAVSERFALK